MDTISRIELRSLLPLVFRGMEDTESIRASQLWDVPSFVFERGCRVCLHAESGQGKSSLLSFIYGARTDYLGEILFDGRDIRSLTVDQWCQVRTCRIALLPQEMRLFPDLTVMQNIQVKNQRTLRKSTAEIKRLLQMLGIDHKRDVPVRLLSVGQQQRVAAVRTVCQPFDFVLLDEPVSHLDERNNRIVARIIQDEALAQGAGIVSTSVGNPLLLDNPQIIQL